MTLEEVLKELEYRGITFRPELDEGTGCEPWESAAEPEPQYFATLREALDFQFTICSRAASQGTGWVSVEGLKDLRGYFSHRAVENDRRASTKSDESERRWHFAKHDTYKRCAEKLDEVIRATGALPTPPSGEKT